jgi:Protein of unknown function (DUF2568)
MNERSMRSLNLAFRFVLEMLALVALFLLGLSISDSLLFQVVLGLGMPAIAILVWGLFVAPKASRRLPDPTRLAVESGVWLAGAIAFWLAAGLLVAVLFGAAVVVNLVLMSYWGQRGR